MSWIETSAIGTNCSGSNVSLPYSALFTTSGAGWVKSSGVSVRRRLENRVRADVARRARPILHRHRLAELVAQLVGDDAGEQVGAAAGREGDDDLERLGRKRLRESRRADERNESEQKNAHMP